MLCSIKCQRWWNVETLSFKILARNTDVQNLGVITTKDAAEKNDCLVVISQENAKQWVAIYILLSFAGYTGHLAPAPKGQGHSFHSTRFYVLNIICPTVQAPSCVSGSTSQEHLHIYNTQYQDCCRGDSWRRSESYPRWRVFELCSSEPLGGHPLFSGLLIQSYYQVTNWWTHYLYI